MFESVISEAEYHKWIKITSKILGFFLPLEAPV